jgi:hypothetical protein
MNLKKIVSLFTAGISCCAVFSCSPDIEVDTDTIMQEHLLMAVKSV